jgi:hypothetical protein
LIAVPEMGPLWMGYNLHAFPPSWEQAKVLRGEIEKAWRRVLRQRTRVSGKSHSGKSH